MLYLNPKQTNTLLPNPQEVSIPVPSSPNWPENQLSTYYLKQTTH